MFEIELRHSDCITGYIHLSECEAKPVRLSYLPEFAALLVAHARLIAAEPSRITDDIIGQQYIACRDRANHWMQEVDRTSGAEAFSAESLLASQHPIVDLAERILVNDVLIRSWAAVLTMTDRTHSVGRMDSIARNMHLGQLVLRHRVLSRVLANSGATNEEIKHVNVVREKVERWTDMLIGQLDPTASKDFAFQPDRASDFARTYSNSAESGPDNAVWKLILGGIRSAFRKEIRDSSLVSPDDRAVITAILAGVGPEVTRLTLPELGPRVGSLKL